jgi:hypothetical protein
MSGPVKMTTKKTQVEETATAPVVGMPEKKPVDIKKAKYQEAVRFVNLLIASAKKETEKTRFAYGNKSKHVDEFNSEIEKGLTEKLSAVRDALEKGLTLRISYGDSAKQVPHSLKFVDKNGNKQGPAIYNFAPNFNQPVSVGYVEYKDNKIVSQQDWTYNPIKEYARAVHDKSMQLSGRKDLENPMPIDVKPSVIDKINRFIFFKKKALNRNVINPLKDAVKEMFGR